MDYQGLIKRFDLPAGWHWVDTAFPFSNPDYSNAEIPAQ